MATIEYSLFRAKMIRPAQQVLFNGDISPRTIFESALKERPSVDLRPGRTWHIGNITMFGRDSGYFAFGRTTQATNSKFDVLTGNFIEEEFETSPYTHVVFNAAIGFIGIAHNHRLARRATGIASKLERVLQETHVVMESHVEVVISPITDPDGFLKAISRAYRVLRFTAHFTGPNPVDADEYFQKPLSVYAAIANARKGKTQVDGEDLNKQVVADVARSTAATGNKATARVRPSKKQAPVTISLEDDPVKRRFDEATHDPKVVADELSSAYDEVRHDG